MGFGGCFQNLGLIDGEFCDAFLAPLLSSPDRLTRALQFLKAMKFNRVDAFGELHRRLVMPVSFVWGAADPTFPEPDARKMAMQFPNVLEFRTIQGGKLFMHEEQAERVAEAIIDSFKTIP
jgi:pimeloyl-ACP methyl ester carboxylesterase